MKRNTCKIFPLLVIFAFAACSNDADKPDADDVLQDESAALDGPEHVDMDGGEDLSPEQYDDSVPDQVELEPDAAVDLPGEDVEETIDETEVISPEDLVPYNSTLFMATHNSYSGGALRSIREQLDHGVRLIEFDIHLNSYETYGYRIGHANPGDSVMHGAGNPAGDAFGDWLEVISDWSDSNPGHAPITVLIDFKDSLGSVYSFAEGNLAALNETLEAAFGPKLYEAEQFDGTWPVIGDLRGRILTVLSGSESVRLGYIRDPGHNPSVGMNAHGHVVEIHDSGGGYLWYWTGEVLADGRIRWHRHGRYDTGANPAVAVNNHGWIVEVHEHEDTGRHEAFHRTGHLGPDFEITWFGSGGTRFPGSGNGNNPTISFDSLDGYDVTEIHESESTGEHWTIHGTLDPGTGVLAWSDPIHTPAAALFDKTEATAGAYTVSVFCNTSGPFGSDTLLYSTAVFANLRIRYWQVAFSEFQYGGSDELRDDGVPFMAGTASSLSVRDWAATLRSSGEIVRLWGFNDISYATDPAINFPATDECFEPWYIDYCSSIGTID